MINITKNISGSKSVNLTRQIIATNKYVFSRKRACINFLVIMIICLALYLIYTEKEIELMKSNLLNASRTQTITNSQNAKNITALSGNNQCNPIRPNDDLQYKILINNVQYPQYVPLHFNKKIDFDCLNNNSFKKQRMPVILFWNKLYGDPNFYKGVGKRTPFESGCPAVNCETTNDKARLNEADLVLVSMVDQIPDIPKQVRPPNQRWVFTIIESPIHYPAYTQYNGVFNLSATYMSESDFSNSYEYQGNYYWKQNESFNENHDFHGEKIDKVAALISNCHAGSRRIEYINELKKFIPVKLYGNCGEPCPKVSRITNKTAQCKEILGTEFRFFLAFENSFCKDYITEKFFLMLAFNTVPVVLGGGRYSKFVPKSAYVDALDYDSPKKLAEYLNYLDQNKTAYNAYFKWKKHIWFHNIQTRFSPICSMCIKLHLEDYTGGVPNTVVSDIRKIWDRKMCRLPSLQRIGGVLYYSIASHGQLEKSLLLFHLIFYTIIIFTVNAHMF